MSRGGQYKNYKKFMDLCSYKHDFHVSAEWMFLATSYCKSPCDIIGGAVKTTCGRRSLQRSLSNKILDYRAILDLCENEMMPIKFFGTCKESIISVKNLEIEK